MNPCSARLPSALGVMALLCVGCAAATAQQGPVLDSVDPPVIEPNRPAELTLTGSGFVDGMKVLIQGVRTGRYITYTPVVLSGTEATVRLPLGFPRQPQQREILVSLPDGSRSPVITFGIGSVSRQDSNSDAADSTPDTETATTESTETAGQPASNPVIAELQPERASAGLPFNLLIVGSGFAEGAEVVVLANTRVGSAKEPLYQPVPFEAAFLAEELLEVVFDIGFAPQPAQRTVFVRNPDGAESNRVSLRIFRLGENK